MSSIPISVIIPTVDRTEIALQTLRAFENQSFTNFELILLDQTATPCERLANFQTRVYRYRYHHISTKSLPNARNVAAGIAEAELLLFVDDDVIPDPRLVSSYLEDFQEHGESVWLIGGQIHETGSNIFSESDNIAGGYVRNYGKTLKNFIAEKYSECEWVGGGNFAVRKKRFFEIGGFDTNFIGNAMLEDGDFGFRIRSKGGRVLFSPKPKIEHLRAQAGGTRRFEADLSMYYRGHNTVYFFRKHKRRRYLPFVFLYLNAVALNDLFQRKHSIKAFYYTLKGFVKGFSMNLPESHHGAHSYSP